MTTSVFFYQKKHNYILFPSHSMSSSVSWQKNKHQNQTSTFAMDKSENKNKYKSHIASIVWSKIKNTKRLALMKKTSEQNDLGIHTNLLIFWRKKHPNDFINSFFDHANAQYGRTGRYAIHDSINSKYSNSWHHRHCHCYYYRHYCLQS